jgi:hypothetical protein
MHRTTRMSAGVTALALAATGGVLGTTAGASAGAADPVAPRTTLASHLISPLSAAIQPNGTAYISANFAGMLVKVKPGKRPRPVFQAPQGVEVGGVSLGGGPVTFTLTRGQGMTAEHSSVMHMSHAGHVSKFADTGRFERRRNPDQGVTYGFPDLSKKCGAKLPPEIPGKNGKYTGIVDTHPYGTAVAGGTTYVADAAGNDILRISKGGHIRLVTVLPAVPFKVTKARAKASHLPACTVGHEYWFEPVPTDVEMGPGGLLYVSALTGGPEDNSFGPKSLVYTVDPSTGTTTKIGDRLAGAVGLAVTGTGDVYVSQLFGGKISLLRNGSSTPETFRKAAMPAAVELVDGHVHATTNVLSDPPRGRLVRFDR